MSFRSNLVVAVVATFVGSFSTWWFGTYGLGAKLLEFRPIVAAPLIDLTGDLGRRLAIKYNAQTLQAVSASDIYIVNYNDRDTQEIVVHFNMSPVDGGKPFRLLESYVLAPERLGEQGIQRLPDPAPGVVAFKFPNIKQSGKAEEYRYTVRFLFDGSTVAKIVPATNKPDWDFEQYAVERKERNTLVALVGGFVALMALILWAAIRDSRRSPYRIAEGVRRSLCMNQTRLQLTDAQVDGVVEAYLHGAMRPGWALLNKERIRQFLSRQRK